MNSNTMKYGKNPETNDISDELRQVSPLTVRPDPSVWEKLMRIDNR